MFPPAAWTGDVGEAIAEVTATVEQIESALVAPEVEARVSPADGLVRAGARRDGDRLVVIAANAGYEPAEAEITVPQLNGRALSVLDTGRVVKPDGDSFADRLPPLGARIYVTGS